MPLAIPSVHLNGTSREELQSQHCDAVRAGRAFMAALASAAPDGRDYYTQGRTAFTAAQVQHCERMAKVEQVIKELETIAEALVR